MDTLVTARVESTLPDAEADAALDRALAWFMEVERVCSRFDPRSELMQLCTRPGVAVAVSDLLFEVVAFALDVARATGGAFDPTIGALQDTRGFNRNYISGDEVRPPVGSRPGTASYRDVRLDRSRRTIRLRRPLLLDLGAVAKGCAIDLAAHELAGAERYAVEAGGDLYVGGSKDAPPWRIGVRRAGGDGLLGTIDTINRAVCTSGGYERPAADGGDHLVDPRTRRSPAGLVSVTVIAPTAMVADALATAVFVLGTDDGARLLAEQRAAGVLVLPGGEVRVVRGAPGDLSWSEEQS